MPKVRGLQLSSQQTVKLENKNSERNTTFNQAVHKAVVLYKEEEIRDDSLSLTQILEKSNSLPLFLSHHQQSGISLDKIEQSH